MCLRINILIYFMYLFTSAYAHITAVMWICMYIVLCMSYKRPACLLCGLITSEIFFHNLISGERILSNDLAFIGVKELSPFFLLIFVYVLCNNEHHLSFLSSFSLSLSNLSLFPSNFYLLFKSLSIFLLLFLLNFIPWTTFVFFSISKVSCAEFKMKNYSI